MECEETRDLCRKLEASPINAMTYPLVGGTHVPKGWPDRHIIIGHPFKVDAHVEFKRGKNKVTALQLQRILSMLARGRFACACWIGRGTFDGSEYTVRSYRHTSRGPVECDRAAYGTSRLVKLLSWLQEEELKWWTQYMLTLELGGRTPAGIR